MDVLPNPQYFTMLVTFQQIYRFDINFMKNLQLFTVCKYENEIMYGWLLKHLKFNQIFYFILFFCQANLIFDLTKLDLSLHIGIPNRNKDSKVIFQQFKENTFS